MPLTQNLFPIPFPLKQQQQCVNCPFNDCSVSLLYNGIEIVTNAECSNCRRLFCAQCKVPWHSGLNCQQFQLTQLNSRRGISVKRRCPFEEYDEGMGKKKSTTCLMDCPNKQCCLELKLEENLMQSSLYRKFQQQKLKCSMYMRTYEEEKKKEKGKSAVIEFETSNESSSSPQSPKSFCGLCYDFVPESNIVRGSANCNHPFCANCISNHVAAQLSQNIMEVTCPNSRCYEVLKPHHLQHILPEEVVVRWAFERFSIAR
ncbi:uncharacterized protein LOC131650402 [Vicia villosa]|uniref:uncharacterized protein LOC131650402 n=1 Tax=Vicia villosa TaxID=3911 RepID=UPI00273B637F|nr:uncharacterized protein LOC131650402 [Vicia villosa]